MSARREHDRCVDDIGGPGDAAEDSHRPSADVGQWFHLDTARVE